MAHKTLINGTAYDIVGGSTLINGTGYSIASGRTVINGTGYDIVFDNGSSFSWPGWNNATWQDINDLCKAKQNGDIANWPNDIVVGSSEKALSFGNSNIVADFGMQNVVTRVRALDELPGTITFSILNDTSFYTLPYSYNTTSSRWRYSWARESCNDLYNVYQPENENYIVPVIKRTCIDFDFTNPQGTYQTEDTEEYFFLPAAAEIQGHFAIRSGTGAQNEGTVYNGTLKQNIYRINEWNLLPNTASYCWTRSSRDSSSVYLEDDYLEVRPNYLAWLCPFFIIGNPNA